MVRNNNSFTISNENYCYIIFKKTDICTSQRGLLFKWQCFIFFSIKQRKKRKYGKHKENRGIKQAEKSKVGETSESPVTIKQILGANFNKSITKMRVKVIILVKPKTIHKNMELLIQIWPYISECCLLLTLKRVIYLPCYLARAGFSTYFLTADQPLLFPSSRLLLPLKYPVEVVLT